MEDKIEVNEYVRTDKGEIAKVTSVSKETLGEIFGTNEIHIGFCNTEPYVYGNIVKHSKQLIDLIEEGDYVNGHLVEEVRISCFNISIFVNEYEIELHENDIKTILTKESYMANCYKVGGKDE